MEGQVINVFRHDELSKDKQCAELMVIEFSS